MAVKKQSITFKVEPRFKQKLEKLAEHYKRTLSDYIRVEMESIVENAEKEGIISIYKKTEER